MDKKKQDILAKLILIRYLIIPKQFIAYDLAEDNDLVCFETFYDSNIIHSLEAINIFIEQVSSKLKREYNYLSGILLDFIVSLPFIDSEDFEKNSPIDDDNATTLFSYFDESGHFSSTTLNSQFDEANIRYIEDFKVYYKWLESKDFESLLQLLLEYKNLLMEYNDILD